MSLKGAGVIIDSANTSCLKITSLYDIVNIIIPHFDKYPLLSKKGEEFKLFKEIALIKYNKQHLTEEGFYKILSIKAAMHNGLTEALAEDFPNIVPVNSITQSNSLLEQEVDSSPLSLGATAHRVTQVLTGLQPGLINVPLDPN